MTNMYLLFCQTAQDNILSLVNFGICGFLAGP